MAWPNRALTRVLRTSAPARSQGRHAEGVLPEWKWCSHCGHGHTGTLDDVRKKPLSHRAAGGTAPALQDLQLCSHALSLRLLLTMGGNNAAAKRRVVTPLPAPRPFPDAERAARRPTARIRA